MRICYQSKRRKGNSSSFQGLETVQMAFNRPFMRAIHGEGGVGEKLEVGIIPVEERGFPTLLCPPVCGRGRAA